MTKTCRIVPDGWPVKVEECPPGFFMCDDQLCFRNEYGQNGIFNSAGEYFVTRGIMVQPVIYEWELNDE